MEENKQEQKKIQQNLLNYVSHNLTNKKDKPKEKERSDSKSSTGKETKTSADKSGKARATNVTSGPKQQRPKTGAGTSAIGGITQSTTGSNSRESRQGGSERIGTTKTLTPTSNQTPKTRTPPSIERSNPPPKKLNMEAQVSQSHSSPQIDDITRSNVSQYDDTKNPGTRSNSLSMETNTIPRQNINENLSDGEINDIASDDIKIDNIVVTNPYDDEMDNDETLEDLGPELAKMGRILAREITKSLSAALVPLQNELNELKSLKTELVPADMGMTALKKENDRLKTKVDQMETKNLKLKKRLSDIEDKLLENNLMFFGLDERDGETECDRYETIIGIIASTLTGPNYDDKLQSARQIQIEKLVRKGKYNRNGIRPISVTFSHHRDLLVILLNRKYLPAGIMVSREYGKQTETERKLLKPILKAANTKTSYKRKCHLEGDQLIIKGKHYTRDNLCELPDDLSCYKVTSKEDINTVGFFGELNPLSNFHQSHFAVDNQWYHCTEQFIQEKKAIYFNDNCSALKIMAADTALECKQLARNIRNYDVTKWNAVAGELCYNGILEKFNQNPHLNKVLQSTGDKVLAESCYDKKWGTGIPLYSSEALRNDLWTGENLLGKLLTRVRETLRIPEDLD